MKAFLLAAGVGSRLRPVTDSTPKCMLRFDGQPLVDLWLDGLAAAGADEVLVNLHHLPNVVRQHLASRSAPPVVRTSYEPDLLGSLGTLLAHRDWVAGDEAFLACYADNLTDFDLRRLVDAHTGSGALATIAVFRAERPSACGILDVDGEGWVTAFTEKPAFPTGNLANAGIYAFHPSVLDGIDQRPPIDIGYHLLPRLIRRARTVAVDGYFRDIGTLESYRLAQEEWRPRSLT